MRKEAVKTSLFPGVSYLGGKCFLGNGLAKGDPITNPEITDNIWVSSLDYPKRHLSLQDPNPPKNHCTALRRGL